MSKIQLRWNIYFTNLVLGNSVIQNQQNRIFSIYSREY